MSERIRMHAAPTAKGRLTSHQNTWASAIGIPLSIVKSQALSSAEKYRDNPTEVTTTARTTTGSDSLLTAT
jgi:hypothetical protein